MSQTTLLLTLPGTFLPFSNAKLDRVKNVDFELRHPTLKEPFLGQKLTNLSKLRTFLRPEFCGLLKNGQNIYPLCFGGQKIARKKNVQQINGHPVDIRMLLSHEIVHLS